MMGGTLDLVGVLLIIIGALAVLAGLGAAGYGYVAEEDKQDGLVAHPDGATHAGGKDYLGNQSDLGP